MKFSIGSNSSLVLTRLGSALAVLAVLIAISAAGCDVGNEGGRCNPYLSHDECGSGLQCTQPADCPENYCCPVSGVSSNPFCQPGCGGGLAAICAANPNADSDCGAADASPVPDGGEGGTSDAPSEAEPDAQSSGG